MDARVEDGDFIRELRTGRDAAGCVFWLKPHELAVLDPEAAEEINAANFADLTLPDGFLDLLMRRRSAPVSWKEVRISWNRPLQLLSNAQGLRQLAARMQDLLDQRRDRPVDLVWATQEVCTQALLPTVIAGLSAANHKKLLRGQNFKLSRLMSLTPESTSLWHTARAFWIQGSAGLVVRRELRERARGRRPRQVDLTDPIVDLLPRLGMDRAVDTVTAVLTAIAGPPGAVAACLVLELTRQPDWADRLQEELAPISLACLCEAVTRAAPLTYRFVKETLRMWSSPMVLTRVVTAPFRITHASLEAGDSFHVSPFFGHHDPQRWKDPDKFDPDRWLSESQGDTCPRGSYVPFGWAPTSCIGAGLGIAQMVILCHLLCTRYRIQVYDPDSVSILLGSVPLPRNFQGQITCR
jgi:cytochrome P450